MFLVCAVLKLVTGESVWPALCLVFGRQTGMNCTVLQYFRVQLFYPLPLCQLFVCLQTLFGNGGVGLSVSKDHSAFCLRDQAEFLHCFTLKMKAS